MGTNQASDAPFTRQPSWKLLGRAADRFESLLPKTSFLRVLGVCISFPLPALAIAIAMECIPYKDPRDGWKANYAAFIRYAIGYVIVGIGAILQMRQLVPGIDLSMTKVVCTASAAAACATCVMIADASQWRAIPYGTPVLLKHLKLQVLILVTQASMMIAYPALSTVYYALTPTGQTFLVVLLPVMKLAMQNAMAWASSLLEEYIAGITVFSVEVFNALYMSKCMQSGTFATYLVIMAFDLLESVLAFRDIDRQSYHVLELKKRCNSSDLNPNLLHAIVELCKQPGMLRNEGKLLVRARSPIPLQLSRSNTMVLERISNMYCHITTTKPTMAKSSVVPSDRNIQHLDEIGDIESANTSFKSETESRETRIVQKQKLVEQALQLLFATEYHALVEYVECIISMIYGIYVVVLVQVPNAAYFPETRQMTSTHVHSMATNLLLYAGLEVLSFIGLHYAIKRKSGFSPAYLLVFVLENQTVEFQARVKVWLIFVLQLTLQHYAACRDGDRKSVLIRLVVAPEGVTVSRIMKQRDAASVARQTRLPLVMTVVKEFYFINIMLKDVALPSPERRLQSHQQLINPHRIVLSKKRHIVLGAWRPLDLGIHEWRVVHTTRWLHESHKMFWSRRSP